MFCEYIYLWVYLWICGPPAPPAHGGYDDVGDDDDGDDDDGDVDDDDDGDLMT